MKHMKTIASILTIILFSLTVSAQQSEKVSPDQDVVINHKMIEKFNNAEYSSDKMDFNTILTNYNFSDIKLIMQAYKTGDIELKPENIETYLSSTKTELNKEINLEKYTEGQVFASQKK